MIHPPYFALRTPSQRQMSNMIRSNGPDDGPATAKSPLGNQTVRILPSVPVIANKLTIHPLWIGRRF